MDAASIAVLAIVAALAALAAWRTLRKGPPCECGGGSCGCGCAGRCPHCRGKAAKKTDSNR